MKCKTSFVFSFILLTYIFKSFVYSEILMDYGGIDWGIKNAFKEIKLLLLSLSGGKCFSFRPKMCVTALHSMNIKNSVWII